MAAIGIGSEIGGYRLTDLIGEGGMGAVYLAEGEGGERAALKVMPPDLAANESFRRRFLRESRYAREVDHPNVVRIRDAGEANGALYIVMDYVPGTDLKALLAAQGPLEPRRALGLLAQVALALDAVHAAGLIHRDVKPGNVIVTGADEDERAFLTDFGLSRSPARDSIALTAAGEFVGTYFYTAPEQILGADPDHRVDIYSLGCVLFECVAGEPPFLHENSADLLHAHIDDPPPGLSDRRAGVNEAVDVVIARALAKVPKDRFATCAELIASARAAFMHNRAPTPPPTAPPVVAAPAPVAGGSPPSEGGSEKLRLKVTAGNATGTKIEVSDELVIGRHAEGVGRLADDVEISRRHARLTRAGSGFVVEDLGSTNGTFLNGRRIEGPELLSVGDEIELGGTRMIVQVSATTPPATPTPAPAHDTPPSTPVPLATEPLAPAEAPAEAAAEPSAADAAPGEPAAAEPTPAEPAPVEPLPAEPAPVEPLPAEPAPAEPAAADAAPAEPAPPAAPTPLPRVALRIELDLEAGEAHVALDDSSDSVRLVFEDGSWRIARPD
jgi:Protein kinase domain/FHA domain